MIQIAQSIGSLLATTPVLVFWLFAVGVAPSSVSQAAIATRTEPESGVFRVYVGTYTSGGGSRGIYLLDLDLHSGKLSEPQLACEATDPSFLAIHPGGRLLYAVSERNEVDGQAGGAVLAFAIAQDTGRLKLINHQSSRGAGPCHLIVDRVGKNVLVANYGGGSIASLPIDPDGRLDPSSTFIQHKGQGSDPSRQEGPHCALDQPRPVGPFCRGRRSRFGQSFRLSV